MVRPGSFCTSPAQRPAGTGRGTRRLSARPLPGTGRQNRCSVGDVRCGGGTVSAPCVLRQVPRRSDNPQVWGCRGSRCPARRPSDSGPLRATGSARPEARMERAARLLNLGEQAAAERDLVLAIRAGLPPAIAAEAWYRLGLLRLRSGAAMYAFEQAARDPEQAARDLYWLGQVLASSGRSGQARSVWHRVEQQYPGSVWAARSLLALASRAEGAGARRTADAILTEVVRRFPGSHFAEEAHWRRGWLKYRLGRFAQAEAIWLRAAQTLPASSRAAANLYWAAKANEQRGRSARSLLEQIARRYPLTYYGQRARSRLRWPAPARTSPPDDGSP